MEKILFEWRTDEPFRTFKDNCCGTIRTINAGGDKYVLEVKVIGQMDNTMDHTFESANRIYDTEGLAPTVNTCGGGGLQPKIIVAMRGRNPENPSDRTPGVPTVQRLEPNSQGICNTLTSVTKDNLVMETVKIKNNNAKGYEECVVGGVADFLYPSSTTRRGRVQENGNVSPTLTSENSGVCRIEKVGNIYSSGGQNGNVYDESSLAPTISSGATNTAGNGGIGSNNAPKICYQYRIRKLTPLECWRLMGFSDEDFHKAEQVNSNTQLYKQAGNSIVVDVLEAIFSNLL